MSDISLEQSLKAYRVMNTPTKYSWKQHWVQEIFSKDDYLLCSEEERERFDKRLKECGITICSNIKQKIGRVATLKDLVDIILSTENKKTAKINKQVVYSTSSGNRPIGEGSFIMWNGLQVIDMDIKDGDIAKKMKSFIFEHLYKCNWFLGVSLSSSGKGLHVYTKISIPESDKEDINKKKLLYYTNYRHKYSFVYIVCKLFIEQNKGRHTKDDIIKWMDMSMGKPQQGVFIGYDSHPLISTRFFEDFIYVNFDNVEDIGSPEVDWVTDPELKVLFKRWEWFEEGNRSDIDISIVSAPEPVVGVNNKVHYKHFERWRLANTLVRIYGTERGYKYLRQICSNSIKDKELQADCITAERHNKPIDSWAVNRLNSQHGFNIKMNIKDELFDNNSIINNLDLIPNPTLVRESRYLKTFNISKDQHLSDISDNILSNLGRVTLLEAGAGVGKTEMVKSLTRLGKKIIMVMPFTSTIKSKVENDKNWIFFYGNRKVKLNTPYKMVSMTIDKFSKLNLMDIKVAGYDYIFIDESHLMFQSEYRPVMSKVIDMIRTTEIPIILMSGTPSGELLFFPDIVHIHVIKEDIRKKDFNINYIDSPKEILYYMCKNMARDISVGRRILFPTNKGTLYSRQIESAVNYFLVNDYANFTPVKMHYYKKSNIGESFMDKINFEKTVEDTQILLCTNYLSVGVDILDKYCFSIYFVDLMMPQEVEQFANRLRSNDLYISLYVARNDSDGNPRYIDKYREMNLTIDDDEKKDALSIIEMCNKKLQRNDQSFMYNPIISSFISDRRFVTYNELERKYYLNEIAYSVIYFERRYRDYVQQLPVLVRGMQSYGYNTTIKKLDNINISETESFLKLKESIKVAYDAQLSVNTSHVEELLNNITEDRLPLYRDVIGGGYDIRKSEEWGEDLTGRVIRVKNIEVFEKVVPIFVSFAKRYSVKDIKSIFEYCRNKNHTFNFAAINRIRVLSNILYNDKNERLDLPIKTFMKEVYVFTERSKCKIKDLEKFVRDFALRYAKEESSDEIIISNSRLTVESLYDRLMKVFKCLVSVSRPNKRGEIMMNKVELMWEEKEYYESTDNNDKVFILDEFLDVK